MEWEPEQGGRVHQQQLQASSKFKGDAKDLQACGFWKQNLLGMGRVGKNWHVKKYFVKQWCHAVSDNINFKGRGPLPQLQKSSIWFFHFVFEHNPSSKSLHGIAASQNILSHLNFLSISCPLQAHSFSRPHSALNLLHLPRIYYCLATAADAPCMPALVPTSLAQEDCALLLGQGPRWGLNLCPPGWSLLWYNFKVRQFAVHSWSLSRPIETKWHRQCDAFLIIRFLELCFWTCVQGSSSEDIVFFFSLFLCLCSLSVSLFCVCCWLVVHWLFKIIILKDCS